MSDFIAENTDKDQIDRRGSFKCMAWAGTGVLFSVDGGTATPLGRLKWVYYLLVAATLLLGSNGPARDLTTITGDVFKNISVRSKDPMGIQIMHDDGVAFLDFKSLSEADQNDFGFDLAAYADVMKQKVEAAKLRREQAELATLQAIALAKSQIAQASASAHQTFKPRNQTDLEVSVDGPDFMDGGYPFWDFTNVIPFGSRRNFGTHHNSMISSPPGIHRH